MSPVRMTSVVRRIFCTELAGVEASESVSDHSLSVVAARRRFDRQLLVRGMKEQAQQNVAAPVVSIEEPREGFDKVQLKGRCNA